MAAPRDDAAEHDVRKKEERGLAAFILHRDVVESTQRDDATMFLEVSAPRDDLASDKSSMAADPVAKSASSASERERPLAKVWAVMPALESMMTTLLAILSPRLILHLHLRDGLLLMPLP